MAAKIVSRISNDKNYSYVNLFTLDAGYENAAYEACSQVLVCGPGHVRPYALVPLMYRGRLAPFAIPLHSNIRWDLPSRWFVPASRTPKTRRGNHRGFDIPKMVPVNPDVVSVFEWVSSPMPIQYQLVSLYPTLVSKAQAYLDECVNGDGFNEWSVDVDAISRWVLPAFDIHARKLPLAS